MTKKLASKPKSRKLNKNRFKSSFQSQMTTVIFRFEISLKLLKTLA